MYKTILIFLLLGFFSISLKAEVVKDIKISGNKRVSDETIKIYGDIVKNKDYSENDVNKILRNLYSTNFFQEIKIDLSNNILKINLIEFPIINQLIIVGEEKKSYADI